MLTARLGDTVPDSHKPLTPKEYGRFAEWLRSHSLTPERLLSGDLQSLLQEWADKKITVERIQTLLDRGTALALALEKWTRAGLWVMSRSDPDYPKKLKQRLGSESPAILFGCGNRKLLNSGGLAVVGSRNASKEDLVYAGKIGELTANAGFSIISGGARGIDEAAMLGALEVDGTAVGILANGLLQACASRKYRHALRENNLVLVSPFNPEAGFNVGNAMARNKYIYCLADAALVVHSGRKGGTWNGAQENLKKSWVPLWVKPTEDSEAGNQTLIDAGALAAPENLDNTTNIDAFFKTSHNLLQNLSSPQIAQRKPFEAGSHAEKETPEKIAEEKRTPNPNDYSQMTFYHFFLHKVSPLCTQPRTTEELVEELGLKKTQLNAWLKQAVKEGHLEKLNSRPDSYRIAPQKPIPFEKAG
ncbi:MAG TPA: DNA-processing protein DprA [Methylothermaceae bacterium]|nr:DNA-processing protein DprA [Methylothermaceae bacterium]